MSVYEQEGVENTSYSNNNPKIDLLKSPARLLAHLQKNNGNETLTNQILEAAQWILCSPEAIGFCQLTALCYDVPTKLQDGPQCGLVALWMASNTLIRTISNGNNEINERVKSTENDSEIVEKSQTSTSDMFPSVDWIQNMAKVKQFSRKGEMFSADNLAILAEICFQHYLNQCSVENTLSAYVIKNDVYSLLTSYEKMVDFFANNSYHQVLLVPYDSDYDQRPCRKRGHKSHWCIISGIATFISHSKLTHAKSAERLNSYHYQNDGIESNTQTSTNSEYVQIVDDSSKIVVIAKSKMLPKPYSKLNDALKNEILHKEQKKKTSQLEDEDDSCFYLIAKQSKSKRTFLFDPHQLAISNRNLVEISSDPYIEQSGISHEEIFNKYILPPGGLRDGLANQVVVLRMPV